MRVNISKFELILAQQCKTVSSLRPGFSPVTLAGIRKGREMSPRTIGRLAKALGVPVEALIEEVEERGH